MEKKELSFCKLEVISRDFFVERYFKRLRVTQNNIESASI